MILKLSAVQSQKHWTNFFASLSVYINIIFVNFFTPPVQTFYTLTHVNCDYVHSLLKVDALISVIWVRRNKMAMVATNPTFLPIYIIQQCHLVKPWPVVPLNLLPEEKELGEGFWNVFQMQWRPVPDIPDNAEMEQKCSLSKWSAPPNYIIIIQCDFWTFFLMKILFTILFMFFFLLVLVVETKATVFWCIMITIYPHKLADTRGRATNSMIALKVASSPCFSL